MKSQLDNLVAMVNQIATNNAHWGDQAACAERVATHLKKFWAPSMLNMIFEYDGHGLHPVAAAAIARLKPA